ncbi:uncharacterized protein (DUF305 family) [Streptomyces sp. SAI-135]|uniref:DUF305 domain-containing protein n=1 Tax=unclassified Streptomyces TaxID=2593676 RepID=UPI002476BAFA|nr:MULTISPECIES: DUF305 domain-containing protein [unclassified Streptomyces]MDH6515622.1 uncharacterized protein (DUF305 family) [Streptomyces sp. SAI-090]MDH6620291.1 uncharacterized protein (DUF305 family) [Streptomyces sp. SAI-135]
MRTTRTLIRRACLAAVAVSAALTLTACGGDSDDSASAKTSASANASAQSSADAHNDQDVSFAQGMIPHHQQAVEMAGMVDGRASSAEVKDLAARIEKAQGPEIETMTGWLKTWGEQVPETMPGMDHSAHSGMAGMMTGADMEKLKKASGKDFDTMFLTMMVEHHEGAVEMATTEKAKGESPAATAMAGDIITAQNAEISEMKKLLGEN